MDSVVFVVLFWEAMILNAFSTWNWKVLEDFYKLWQEDTNNVDLNAILQDFTHFDWGMGKICCFPFHRKGCEWWAKFLLFVFVSFCCFPFLFFIVKIMQMLWTINVCWWSHSPEKKRVRVITTFSNVYKFAVPIFCSGGSVFGCLWLIE